MLFAPLQSTPQVLKPLRLPDFNGRQAKKRDGISARAASQA
jgi:hypothetical protein